MSVICLLQVSHQLGRPINRKFHTPRKIEFVEQGWGLNIAPPPEPRPPRVRLTFAIFPTPVWLVPLCTSQICPLDSHLFYLCSGHYPMHASLLPSDLAVAHVRHRTAWRLGTSSCLHMPRQALQPY